MTSGIIVWTKNMAFCFFLALLASCGIQGMPIPPENVPPETPVESTTLPGSSSKNDAVGPTSNSGKGQGGVGKAGVGADKMNGSPGGTSEEDGSGGDDDGQGEDSP